MKTKIILAVFGLLLLAGIGWTTRHRYDHLPNGWTIRTNLYTGETCLLQRVPVITLEFPLPPGATPVNSLDELLQKPKTESTYAYKWVECGQ